MADVKISALPVAASVALTDYIPCVVGGTTSRATFTVVRAGLLPIVLTADVTGTLPAGNGGTGVTSLGTNWGTFFGISLAAGYTTFAGTPSGANLATLLTSALPASKGGTGLTALGTNVATLLGSVLAAGYTTFAVTPSGANLASLLTSALPVSKGGTGATASTGSGNVVLATSPTLATATNTGALTTGGIVQSGTTLNASVGGTINNVTLGGNLRIRFTDATGPTITGFDATGVADGTILAVYAGAGVIAITHEGAGSIAANRCSLQGGTTINVAIGVFTFFMYLTDGTNSRWRHLAATAI